MSTNLAFTNWLNSLVHKVWGFALVYLPSSRGIASTLPKSHLCSACIIFFILLWFTIVLELAPGRCCSMEPHPQTLGNSRCVFYICPQSFLGKFWKHILQIYIYIFWDTAYLYLYFKKKIVIICINYWGTWWGACKEIGGQLVRIISLLPPHGSQDQSHDC